MGKQQANGKPRCKCKKCDKTFQLQYTNNNTKPQTKQLITKMSLKDSGIRDISQVLNLNSNTILSFLKKQKSSSQT
jgi:transposase-like protein